jgi:hypothetical protein
MNAQSKGSQLPDSRDNDRVKIIAEVSAGALPQITAAEMLNVTPRQVSRLTKTRQRKGPAGLVHRGRGRRPHNNRFGIPRSLCTDRAGHFNHPRQARQTRQQALRRDRAPIPESPEGSERRHHLRPLAAGQGFNLDGLLCEQEVRTVRNDLTISLNARNFQIFPHAEDGNLRRKKVTIELRFNG